MTGKIEYATYLYKPSTVERMSGHFMQLLEAFCSAPATNIQQPCLLTASEKQQILIDWNKTDVSFPNKTIHELFTEQVMRTPEAIALVDEFNNKLTYGELDELSERIKRIVKKKLILKQERLSIILKKSSG